MFDDLDHQLLKKRRSSSRKKTLIKKQERMKSQNLPKIKEQYKRIHLTMKDFIKELIDDDT